MAKLDPRAAKAELALVKSRLALIAKWSLLVAIVFVVIAIIATGPSGRIPLPIVLPCLVSVACFCCALLLLKIWLPVYELFCPHCDKHIPTEIEWKCQFCDSHNTNTRSYPFIYKCEQCSREPAAYVCHNCSTPIALTGTKEATYHPAIKVVPKVSPETREQLTAKRVAEVEERQHHLAIAKLDADLAKFAPRAELKIKSPRERLEIELEEFKARVLYVDDLAEREIALAKENFKDDPERLGRYEEAIREWRDRHT